MMYHFLQHSLVIKQQSRPLFLIFNPILDGTPRVLPKCGLYSPYSSNVLSGENPKVVTMIYQIGISFMENMQNFFFFYYYYF